MSSTSRALGSLVAASLLFACSEQTSGPTDTMDIAASFAKKPGDPGSASSRQFYQIRLGAEPGYGSHGIMLIEIAGGYITATVHASGLMPDMHIPQHIHLNPTCNPGGGILINLDAGLTVPGEGAGTGSAYPVSSKSGVVNYYAQRSLADLRAAVNAFRGTSLATDADLLAWLNLEDRNGHMHVAMGPPFPAVNCGEVVRLK
jgi:hypothetical protein